MLFPNDNDPEYVYFDENYCVFVGSITTLGHVPMSTFTKYG